MRETITFNNRAEAKMIKKTCKVTGITIVNFQLNRTGRTVKDFERNSKFFNSFQKEAPNAHYACNEIGPFQFPKHKDQIPVVVKKLQDAGIAVKYRGKRVMTEIEYLLSQI